VPRHWTEVYDRDDQDKPPAAAGELELRGGACARLRRLLADGTWHSTGELIEAAGHRFGARLLEIRRGRDGRPVLAIEREQRREGGRQVWFYRAVAAE
jgi:hypothetical protein